MRNIACLSFGKDSIAQLIVAKELGISIDDVIYSEVMFDDTLSAEHPLLAEWIPEAEKILKDKFGYKVQHLRGESYCHKFYRKKIRGDNAGKIYMFPTVIFPWCNALKVLPQGKYVNQHKETCEFIGLAYDEPARYERLMKQSKPKRQKRSILYENKITEAKATEICKKHNLYSPHYSNEVLRGGCWFCCKQPYASVYNLWKNYPELFNKLKVLQKDSTVKWMPNYTPEELEERFKNGYIPKVRRRKNK